MDNENTAIAKLIDRFGFVLFPAEGPIRMAVPVGGVSWPDGKAMKLYGFVHWRDGEPTIPALDRVSPLIESYKADAEKLEPRPGACSSIWRGDDAVSPHAIGYATMTWPQAA